MKLNKNDNLFIISMLLLIIIINYNFAIVRISGTSMSPTYKHNEILIIKKIKEPRNNDLIVFEAPTWTGDSRKLIKRIVASEGDNVYINNSQLVVNGVSQEHLKYSELKTTEEIIINKDEYLVLGDNKKNSNDSIYRFCLGEDDYKVMKDNIYVTGKEFLVIKLGRLFNE